MPGTDYPSSAQASSRLVQVVSGMYVLHLAFYPRVSCTLKKSLGIQVGTS